MANLCLSILVLSCFQIVFANFCSKEYNAHQSCDECIRCGGSWCHEKQDGSHCMGSPGDDWCSAGKEQLPSILPRERGGANIAPGYSERTLFPGSTDMLTLTYVSKNELVETFTIHNTTQTKHLALNTINHACDNSKCSLIIEARTSPDFCLRDGSTNEFVYVVVTLTGGLEAAVKYHVPCACECSKKTEKKSVKCNWNGDLTCGVCKCYNGASGDSCVSIATDKCPEKRGDVQCTNQQRSEATCSGNGYCGPCETCICFTDREGSQYFDPNNFCSDICMTTSDCDACLRNGTVGPCSECDHRITVLAYNETVSEERDELDRRIWARCHETVDECYLEYVAMKQEDNSIQVMMIKSCNEIAGSETFGTITTKVPLILGVLGILAAVAAVGGVMLWKHMNSVPPLPLTDPKYENIDAEDCIGENPLYKPPTSSFKNPTYGKW